jgi:YesN/AraC family two-component response regulator
MQNQSKVLCHGIYRRPGKKPLDQAIYPGQLQKKITLPETARKFHMSPDYFGHYFKKEVGASFLYFVNLYRISKAEE